MTILSWEGVYFVSDRTEADDLRMRDSERDGNRCAALHAREHVRTYLSAE